MEAEIETCCGVNYDVEDNTIWAKKQTSHHVRRKKT